MYKGKDFERKQYLEWKELIEGLCTIEHKELELLTVFLEKQAKHYNIQTRIYRKHRRFFFTVKEHEVYKILTGEKIWNTQDRIGADIWITVEIDGENYRGNRAYIEICNVLRKKWR